MIIIALVLKGIRTQTILPFMCNNATLQKGKHNNIMYAKKCVHIRTRMLNDCMIKMPSIYI